MTQKEKLLINLIQLLIVTSHWKGATSAATDVAASAAAGLNDDSGTSAALLPLAPEDFDDNPANPAEDGFSKQDTQQLERKFLQFLADEQDSKSKNNMIEKILSNMQSSRSSNLDRSTGSHLANKRYMRFGRQAPRLDDLSSFDVEEKADHQGYDMTPNKRYMRFGRSSLSLQDLSDLQRAVEGGHYEKRYMRFGKRSEGKEKRYMRFGR